MKTLDTNIINAIADATDNNLHTGAVAILAKVMGNTAMVNWCEWIDECHQFAGHMTQDLLDDRNLVSRAVHVQAKGMYSNYNEIYAAF